MRQTLAKHSPAFTLSLNVFLTNSLDEALSDEVPEIMPPRLQPSARFELRVSCLPVVVLSRHWHRAQAFEQQCAGCSTCLCGAFHQPPAALPGHAKLKHHTLELSLRRSNSSAGAVDVCAPIPSSSSLSVFHHCVSPFLMWTSFACRCLPSSYSSALYGFICFHRNSLAANIHLLWADFCSESPLLSFSSACAPLPISFPFRLGPVDSLYESIDSILLGSGFIGFTSPNVPSSHSRIAVPTRLETRH
ncbi:hypothetical protein FB451DRAFT_300079 [Mycena latifolia]|nr:hypothetical protein FB451DRAFT_300079 [Mycena latifolia]